jgi:hypothetical protein
MPRNVAQLSQGNTFSRSSDTNAVVDSATRVFKVILSSPDEAWDLSSAVGVYIGDPYSGDNPIPCVSIDAKADGESRLVRIVTAAYRATPGFSATASGNDPKNEPPAARPALWSISTSLSEIATYVGRKVVNYQSQFPQAMTNPNGDLYDGTMRLEPVVNINIDQYSYTDQSDQMAFVGFVNSDPFTFSSLAIAPHCCMLQGIGSTPVVENFGGRNFRGFKVTFQFAVRAHWTWTREGVQPVGWDHAIPQTGFNVRAGDGAGQGVEYNAIPQKHDRDYNMKTPPEFAVASGEVVRGMTVIPGTDGKKRQVPCAQPVALNDNGTPRWRGYEIQQRVLINRWCLQPERVFGTNFYTFGINSL